MAVLDILRTLALLPQPRPHRMVTLLRMAITPDFAYLRAVSFHLVPVHCIRLALEFRPRYEVRHPPSKVDLKLWPFQPVNTVHPLSNGSAETPGVQALDGCIQDTVLPNSKRTRPFSERLIYRLKLW